MEMCVCGGGGEGGNTEYEWIMIIKQGVECDGQLGINGQTEWSVQCLACGQYQVVDKNVTDGWLMNIIQSTLSNSHLSQIIT